jgi:uncharacterized membrane protein (DUF2068 family)
MNPSDTRVLRVIAAFKLVKAVLLISVGVAALKLVHANIADLVEDWVPKIGVAPGSRFVGHVILDANALTPSRIKELEIGSFLYAGLFLTQGIGLWLLKRWAEWLTVIITASLLPVEVYELIRHPSAIKPLVFVINMALVIYLVRRIRAEGAG